MVGTLPISKGGTDATDAAAARSSLGITPENIGAAAASHEHSASAITSGTLNANRLPTIPAAQGGTGHDFSSIPANAIIRNSGDNTQLWYTASANGALYATAANGAVKFGTLPIAQGGTGRTTFDEGKVLIGGANNTIDLRAVTNNSSVSSITASSNLITANTLANWNGR
jgi:hypothetical protein